MESTRTGFLIYCIAHYEFTKNPLNIRSAQLRTEINNMKLSLLTLYVHRDLGRISVQLYSLIPIDKLECLLVHTTNLNMGTKDDLGVLEVYGFG